MGILFLIHNPKRSYSVLKAVSNSHCFMCKFNCGTIFPIADSCLRPLAQVICFSSKSIIFKESTVWCFSCRERSYVKMALQADQESRGQADQVYNVLKNEKSIRVLSAL